MSQARITGGFWGDQLKVNAEKAIFYQWEQLETSGCIENFRITAGRSKGFREGWFFSDSDAYKWLDAASRIWASTKDRKLGKLMDDFIELLAFAQAPDGYIFTYNQIFFPNARWQNLQIEHELYCHGHLIEAGVSHFLATGRTDLLGISSRAADRVVADFSGKGPDHTPGHEEIEIALLRLHQVRPGSGTYLEMARQFIEQRGKSSHFSINLITQLLDVSKRSSIVRQMKQEYLEANPGAQLAILPEGNAAKTTALAPLRWAVSALSGKYFQQHAPIREQTKPVGHSVRFAYLETAAAMLARENGDRSLVHVLEAAWEHMVDRRMYITGGIGSLPGMEGFGNDYELDPEFAYAETCAALGSLFWNWEMAQLTGKPKYSDLFEWQLYNAAGVGMSLDGRTYFYNNPLAAHGNLERRPWFAVPCCPSNLSRTWANLGNYLYSKETGRLFIHQYMSSVVDLESMTMKNLSTGKVTFEMASELPWNGSVQIRVKNIRPGDQPFEVVLRQPSWASGMTVLINDQIENLKEEAQHDALRPTASGYDPRAASFKPILRSWKAGDVIEIKFEMPVILRKAHPKVKGHENKVALTRGPLVYCLEDLDHPDLDIFNVRLDPASLEPKLDKALLGGITKIEAKSCDGKSLTFIPYFRWGNRGRSKMTVWINT